jgi:DNA-directed RNA polymerase subunit RPC12/RpoP
MAYIRKERLLADILDKSIIHKSSNVRDFLRIFYKMVEQQTEADVEKIRHGEWLYNTDDFTPKMRCSSCGYNKPLLAGENIKQEPNNYCPNCGAKMDGGKNGNV